MSPERVPGWIWIALLTGGPMLTVLLGQVYGAETKWVLLVSGLIGIAVAVIKAVTERSVTANVELRSLANTGKVRGSYWGRVLKG